MSKTNTNSSKSDKKTLLNPIHELIELGHSQGFITFSNIISYFPDAKKDVTSLEKAFASLLEEDIPYIEEMRKMKLRFYSSTKVVMGN